jgi:hypothetical protein
MCPQMPEPRRFPAVVAYAFAFGAATIIART